MESIANELLIAAVERREHIYDKSNDQHFNRTYINREWEEIGDELGTDGHSARKRWTILRDYFVKSHRAFRADKRRKWYLYDSMLFLLPHLAPDKKASILCEEPDDAEISQEADYISVSAEHSSLEPGALPMTMDEAPKQEYVAPTAFYARKRKSKFSHERSNQEISIDGEMLQAIMGGLSSAEHTKDEDELFLLSLAPKLKVLDPLLKTECQAEMQMLLLRYMRRALKPRSPSPTN